MQSDSAIPIHTIDERVAAVKDTFGQQITFTFGNMLDDVGLHSILTEYQPDTIVHLAECPSAAYSMIDQHHAFQVQYNNVLGTLNLLYAMKDAVPEAHLVKIGTMGEYGTPNITIPEGFFEIKYEGRKDTLPFPRQAGSWYHWSKVHDSNNVWFATQLWGLKATDIMQGIVYGVADYDDPRLLSRLDFDEAFGTVINRFCCQAVIGHPLTVYGEGRQKRSYLPLADSMQCLKLVIDNPPKENYRVLNQFRNLYPVWQLAEMVKTAGLLFGLRATIEYIESPRFEITQDHYYNPKRERLEKLGYKPRGTIYKEITQMLKVLQRYKDRIGEFREVIMPKVRWCS